MKGLLFLYKDIERGKAENTRKEERCDKIIQKGKAISSLCLNEEVALDPLKGNFLYRPIRNLLFISPFLALPSAFLSILVF